MAAIAKRQRLLLLAVCLIALCTAPLAHAQAFKSCAEILPNPVVELIGTKFPGWRHKEISDIDLEYRRFWQEKHGNQCLSVAIGHFESLNRLSYAVLLIPQTDPIGGYKLLMFDKMQTADAYILKLVDHWDEKIYSGVVISPASPGKYSQFENAKLSVTTKLDGIYLELIEKGAILYYWSAGGYKKLQVWG